MTEKEKIVNECIYSYGIIAVLYLLNELERLEKYEECQLIVAAVINNNKYYGLDYPTRYNKKSVAMFLAAVKEFHPTLNGQNILNKIPYYTIEARSKLIMAK